MVLPGATEILGKENDVHIAKIAWLSRKDIGKAYGSMVVYVTKGSEAARLLQDQYFHFAGESAYTRPFEPRYRPQQCYRCQELGHKAFTCTKLKDAQSALKQDTTIANVKRSLPNALHVGGHMNRLVGIAEYFTLPAMNRTLQVLQLNVRKQRTVQHSLMNGPQLKDFGVLVLSEPYAWTTDNTVVTVPMGHPNWTKMVPTAQRQERWAFRTMLWIRRDIDAEQVPVQSPDLTAAGLRLPDRSILKCRMRKHS